MGDWDYKTEYDKLLTKLENHKAAWIGIDTQKPPEDGTPVYFMCGVDYKGDTLYDVGYWADYTTTSWYKIYKEAGEDVIDGEWDTEFGNCEVITAWKLVKEIK